MFNKDFKIFFKHDSTIVSLVEVGFSSKVNSLTSWSKKGIHNYIKLKTPLKDRTTMTTCSFVTNNGVFIIKLKKNHLIKYLV